MPPPDAPAVPRRIGRYRLESELGRGGMGVVHAAFDEELERRVALKLLRADRVDDDGVSGRFAQEMRVAIALEHPNIVPVYEVGTDGGVRFIAMRLVDGEDLGAVIRGGALRPGRVARLGRQLAAALDAAHTRGLVHRDVKPGNVLLTGSGDEEHVYLTDFGLTREPEGGVTQTGQWVGTVDYAAPEQIEGGAIGPRTDIYALGCVLYHALTGVLPFTGTFTAKAMAHASTPLPSIGTAIAPDPARIDAVLAMATAKDPQRRHASAGALGRAFARAVADTATDTGQHTIAMAPIGPDTPSESGTDAAADATVVDVPAPVRLSPVAAGTPRPRAESYPRVPPRAAADPAPTAVRPLATPRAARAGDDGPPPAMIPDPGRAPSRPSSRTIAAAAAGVLLVLALAIILARAGDDGASPSAAGSLLSTTGSTSTPSTAASTAAKAIVPLKTTRYTAPAGGYTALVPAAEGWKVDGEQNLGGVVRTVVSGPDGQQLWIDATPGMAPSFGREGRSISETRTITGPLGPIVGYRFTGAPEKLCAAGCVDYQLDLGGRGYAVIAGPTPEARLAARTAIMSLQPAAATTPPATTAAPTTPAAPAPTKKNLKDQQKGRKDRDRKR